MPELKWEFTHAARVAMAARHISAADLKTWAWDHMVNELEDFETGDEFMTAMPERPTQASPTEWTFIWVMKGREDGTVLIDSGRFREMDGVKFPQGHPFEGKKVMVPTGDTEDGDAD